MPVYVVKAVDEEGEPILGVFQELQAGQARIGWSYRDNLDLRLIQGKLNRGESLTPEENDAKRCLGFLTRVEVGDYLLYPHQPQRGQFSVVQVTGEYGYLNKAEGLGDDDWSDFRSFRPCSKTPEAIDMYDEIVPAQLRRRLGRPGRFSKVYNTEAFFMFLRELPEAGRQQDGSNRPSMQRIHGELRKSIPIALHREFSGADLSRKYCPDLFERMGYDPHVQEGPAEAGSDIIVTVNNPLLPDEIEFRIGVQVFAYEGDVEAEALRIKLKQLLGGWEDNSLNYGVLLTTGRCSAEAGRMLREHNRNNPNRLVRLIEGDDLADLFLKYFPPAVE